MTVDKLSKGRPELREAHADPVFVMSFGSRGRAAVPQLPMNHADTWMTRLTPVSKICFPLNAWLTDMLRPKHYTKPLKTLRPISTDWRTSDAGKKGEPPPTHQWPKWDLESLVGQLFPTVELKPSPIPFIRTRQDFQELYRPLPFLGTTHLPPPRPAKIYFSQMLNERARLLQHVTWRIGYLLEIPSKTINTWRIQDCQFNIQYTQITPPNVSTVLHRCNTLRR